jgi:probable phosphomutase (TIGR03848 family)
MTSLYFVRHGVTAHTPHKLSGWLPGIPLSADGRAEAEAAATILERVKFHAIFSSPLERTLETAQILAARQKVDVTVRKGLGEVRYGRWTDRSYASLRRTKLWDRVQHWPSTARFPDGESLSEVQARALGELEKILAEYPRHRVCCVTHADVIRLVVAHYLGVHIDLFQRIVIGPASITVISVGDDGPKVIAVNVPPTPSLKV